MRFYSSLLLVVAATLSAFGLIVLTGCAPVAGRDADVVAIDQETARQIEARADVDDLSFKTAETIDGATYGLVGDGATDNTAIFEALLANGERTIRIPPGDYVTGRLFIASNTILMLEPGVTIRDSGRLSEGESLINIEGANVRIDGLGARIVSRRADYTIGEHRHGIQIYGAKRVVITGVESASHGGDGFYVAGPRDSPAEDVLLRGCQGHDNRRQGLSIISARRVRVIDCAFADTNGTAPQFGIDLEADSPYEVLDDIIFLRPHTSGNEGGGIMIYLTNLDSSSSPVHVSIVDHSTTRESPALDTVVAPGVQATLRYSRLDVPDSSGQPMTASPRAQPGSLPGR